MHMHLINCLFWFTESSLPLPNHWWGSSICQSQSLQVEFMPQLLNATDNQYIHIVLTYFDIWDLQSLSLLYWNDFETSSLLIAIYANCNLRNISGCLSKLSVKIHFQYSKLFFPLKVCQIFSSISARHLKVQETFR